VLTWWIAVRGKYAPAETAAAYRIPPLALQRRKHRQLIRLTPATKAK
jgi:hypothetical protein